MVLFHFSTSLEVTNIFLESCCLVYWMKKNCQIVIGDKKLEQVNQIATKYQEIDKIRIEAESKSEVKKRIYIGIGILLVATSIILISNKE